MQTKNCSDVNRKSKCREQKNMKIGEFLIDLVTAIKTQIAKIAIKVDELNSGSESRGHSTHPQLTQTKQRKAMQKFPRL